MNIYLERGELVGARRRADVQRHASAPRARPEMRVAPASRGKCADVENRQCLPAPRGRVSAQGVTAPARASVHHGRWRSADGADNKAFNNSARGSTYGRIGTGSMGVGQRLGHTPSLFRRARARAAPRRPPRSCGPGRACSARWRPDPGAGELQLQPRRPRRRGFCQVLGVPRPARVVGG